MRSIRADACASWISGISTSRYFPSASRVGLSGVDVDVGRTPPRASNAFRDVLLGIWGGWASPGGVVWGVVTLFWLGGGAGCHRSNTGVFRWG